EQNATFSDHYVETPFDLSEVLFIATANSTAGIPHALLDRLEVIRLSGYTESEKVAIAHEHLLPKSCEKHGLKADQLMLDEATLRALIRGWTREAGVRQLERQLAALSRKIARSIVSGKDLPQARPDNLDSLLGAPPHRLPPHHRSPEVGAVHGLAWTEAGGKLMGIEVASIKGKGHLTLTGQLGDVMKESAQAAYTYVKANAERLGVEEGTWKQVDLHLHVPQGAIPKDGPSAGVAIAVAIASALSGRPVRSDVAMTGEITLRGRVLTIGGVKEKVLAAYHAELSTVLLPIGNEADLEDLPDEVKAAMEFKLLERLDEAMDLLLLPSLEARVPKALEEIVTSLPTENAPIS
ncbi:MAG TPA: S16 family serine protease, partial [Stenomitos sp.]